MKSFFNNNNSFSNAMAQEYDKSSNPSELNKELKILFYLKT